MPGVPPTAPTTDAPRMLMPTKVIGVSAGHFTPSGVISRRQIPLFSQLKAIFAPGSIPGSSTREK